YKTTTPRGNTPTAPYSSQVSMYGEAIVRLGRRVRGGVVFLDGTVRDPMWIPEDERVARSAAMRNAVRGFVEATSTGRFAGVAKDTCDRLGCGYRWLCYPE